MYPRMVQTENRYVSTLWFCAHGFQYALHITFRYVNTARKTKIEKFLVLPGFKKKKKKELQQ